MGKIEKMGEPSLLHPSDKFMGDPMDQRPFGFNIIAIVTHQLADLPGVGSRFGHTDEILRRLAPGPVWE